MGFPTGSTPSQFFVNQASSSLSAFYDQVVFWEIYKNTNQFFVTFEEGKYAIPNNKQESIGTMQLDYPHLSENGGTVPKDNARTEILYTQAPRAFKSAELFQGKKEKASGPGQSADDAANLTWKEFYHGFISLTEIKGNRYWQTNLTSSKFITQDIPYRISGSTNGGGEVTVNRPMTASYFYPFSSYQLSVLREEPSLILNLDKNSELPNDIGSKGFAIIPYQTHQKIKDNIEFYLEKAGLVDKTTKTKMTKKGI
tara:strand:+ start:951 stop:1715 length:765 start_codon:yes stop_codon:yes gene_type:complete